MSNFVPPSFTPEQVTAGDTVQWIIGLPNYMPANWTLTYVLVGLAGNPISIVATDNGDGRFLLSVPAATSADWPAGEYQWQAYISSGSERHQVMRGRMVIKPNYQAQTGAFDPRSTVKKTLDSLKATLEGKASIDQSSYQIQGRSLSRMKPEELIKWLEYYEDLYEKEKQAERVNQGRSGPSKVLVRFNDPTALPISPATFYKAT